jgi:hypothetical protein
MANVLLSSDDSIVQEDGVGTAEASAVDGGLLESSGVGEEIGVAGGDGGREHPVKYPAKHTDAKALSTISKHSHLESRTLCIFVS